MLLASDTVRVKLRKRKVSSIFVLSDYFAFILLKSYRDCFKQQKYLLLATGPLVPLLTVVAKIKYRG